MKEKLITFFKTYNIDLLFYSFLIYNCLVLFQTYYVPTLDAGAHNYNAKIMSALLFGNDPVYSNFYQLNPELVPNWFASALLMVLNWFFNVNVAEKILLLIYFISFPVLFKKIVESLNGEKTIMVLLVFPFTQFCFLYFGFFNFAYGIVLCLSGILYWLKKSEELNFKRIIFFFIICLLTYFSHLFSFISLVIFCFFHETYTFLYNTLLSNEKKPFKIQFKTSFFRSIKLVCCFIVPFILMLSYFSKRPSEGKEAFLETDRLNEMMTSGEVFKSFGAAEDKAATGIFYVLAILMVFSIVIRFIEFRKTKKINDLLQKHDFLFFASMLMLYFFYTQPDADGYGGFISLRLVLYTLVFLSLWLAINKFEKSIKIVSILVLFSSYYFLMDSKKDSLKWLNVELKKFDDVAPNVKVGSIVLPLMFADYNWLGNHYSNYIGARAKVIILENYEASTGYFPTVWKNPEMSKAISTLPVDSAASVALMDGIKTYPFGRIEYLLIYGNKSGQKPYDVIMKRVEEDYWLKHSNKDVYLYERRKDR